MEQQAPNFPVAPPTPRARPPVVDTPPPPERGCLSHVHRSAEDAARGLVSGDGEADGDAGGVIRKRQPWPLAPACLSRVSRAGRDPPPPCDGNGASVHQRPDLSAVGGSQPREQRPAISSRLLGCRNAKPIPQEVETVFLKASNPYFSLIQLLLLGTLVSRLRKPPPSTLPPSDAADSLSTAKSSCAETEGLGGAAVTAPSGERGGCAAMRTLPQWPPAPFGEMPLSPERWR